MFCWLDIHAGAVQALSAMVIVLLTGALVYITWRYEQITNRIAKVTEKQLSASLQPVLYIEVADRMYGHDADGYGFVTFRSFIRNGGTNPVKLITLVGFIRSHQNQLLAQVIFSDENIVLMPEANDSRVIFLRITDRTIQTTECRVALGVHCTDLAGVSQHSFIYDERDGLKHLFGFFKT
jgi:hypothetical protein